MMQGLVLMILVVSLMLTLPATFSFSTVRQTVQPWSERSFYR